MSWFYAEVRLRDPDCPVARSPDLPQAFECLDPGPGGNPIGVVDGSVPDDWNAVGEGPHGVVARSGAHECDECPLAGECSPETLATVQARDGHLDVGIGSDDHRDLQQLVEALREAGQDPVLRKLQPAGSGAGGGGLTDRQRQVLRAAADTGYFSAGGQVTLEDVADEVGGATSTVHEHLQKGLSRLLDERFG